MQDKDFAQVDVHRLYDAVNKNESYTELANGSFFPDIGVIGEWSSDEKKVIKEILIAWERKDYLNPKYHNVEKYKSAYQRLEKMKPGDIARVYVEQTDYLMAAFRSDTPTAKSLVLFVKE